MDTERRRSYLADFKPKRVQDRVRSQEAKHSLSLSREQLQQRAAALRELYLDMSRTRERTTLRERTLAALDARAIAAATDAELLRVPTDPTFIHIKGRLGKRLTAAMQRSVAEEPDPHQLDNSFFVELRTPTPPSPPDLNDSDTHGDSDAGAAAPDFQLVAVGEERDGHESERQQPKDNAEATAEREEAAAAAVAGETSSLDEENSDATAINANKAAADRLTRDETGEPEEKHDEGFKGGSSLPADGATNSATAADAAESGDGGATPVSRSGSAASSRPLAAASPRPSNEDIRESALASPTEARSATLSIDPAAFAAPAEQRRVRHKGAAAFLPRLSRAEPPAAAAPASEPSSSPHLPHIGAALRSHVSAAAAVVVSPADRRPKGPRGGGVGGGGARHASLPELLPAPKPWRPALLCPLCMCRTTDVAHVYEAAKWLRHRMRTPARRSVSLYGLFARS